jgi:hypothetical protein
MIYGRGYHNAAPEPHVARGGFWCGSPVTEDAALNRQEILYRASTKELYTFKVTQKTNAAYLELHTYTS